MLKDIGTAIEAKVMSLDADAQRKPANLLRQRESSALQTELVRAILIRQELEYGNDGRETQREAPTRHTKGWRGWRNSK